VPPGPALTPFGPVHLAMLAAVPLLALALAAAVRAHPGAERPIRRALALFLAVNQLAYVAVAASRGWIAPPRGLPVELCDVAVWLAVAALWGAPRWTGEALWFVSLTGTVQALLTPDLGVRFPSYPGVKFFVGHGGTVAAALFLAFAGRLRVRHGAWWRVLLLVNAYAACLMGLNLGAGTNYMYLRAPPPVPTLLDRLGPWPWYLASSEALAAASFFLLELPVRERRRSPPAG
jgi:hypothetical integral membrane protein (TIGR02206 family)